MIRFPILAAALFLSCSCATTSDAVDVPLLEARARFAHENTVDLEEISENGLAVASGQIARHVVLGRKNITLRIDSPGGSIFAGQRWVRDMEDLKKANDLRFTCVVDGSAYSMGAVILESALCDVRLATTRSTILFHNGSGGSRGTAEELRQLSRFLDAVNDAMALTVSQRIGMDLADYKARIATSDWIMAADEALGLNVIDALVSPSDIAPPEVG